MRSGGSMIRLLIGILVGAATVVFALQNTGTVTYTFLAWQITAPTVVMLLAIYVFGFLTGWMTTGLSRLSRRRR